MKTVMRSLWAAQVLVDTTISVRVEELGGKTPREVLYLKSISGEIEALEIVLQRHVQNRRPCVSRPQLKSQLWFRVMVISQEKSAHGRNSILIWI